MFRVETLSEGMSTMVSKTEKTHWRDRERLGLLFQGRHKGEDTKGKAMKTRDELVSRLESEQAGEGKPIGIGTFFWLEMRKQMLGKDPDVHQYTQADILRFGKVGVWRGHELYIVPVRVTHDEVDDPRPWTGVVG
jgi:hypothetical protein